MGDIFCIKTILLFLQSMQSMTENEVNLTLKLKRQDIIFYGIEEQFINN